MDDSKDPLEGISADERRIVTSLLRMRPMQQKDAPKPATAQAEAQRRRRERERQPTSANGGD